MSEASEQTEIPMLRLISDPLPMSPQLLGLIGVIVVEWSRVESGIVGDTAAMAQWRVVANLATEAPRNFSKKLQLWRRSVRTLYPKIKVYQEFATSFASRAKVAARNRNHLMHGSWDLQPREDGSFRVLNMHALHRVERYEEQIVSLESVKALLGEIMTLSGDISGFMATKMWHAHLGLLKAEVAPPPEPPTPPSSPNNPR